MTEEGEKRVCLRDLTLGDAAFIFELLNTPGWLKHIGDKGIKNIEDARSYLVDGPLKYYDEGRGLGLKAVCLANSNMCIGLCGLLQRDYLDCPDIGYAILPQFYGKGHTYTACCQVIQNAQGVLGLSKLAAITNLDNQPSIRLLNKLNFELKDVIELDGEKINHFELNL